ncbi:hypothetical protein AJ80_03419 [Polytolypa hystricis UAMH7299]|uniref:Uncharacterized protein n=1 Tax=Polytolypa hystricis (strain UAMH7299) TaxID=1447883 RepID=A0A2B7YIV7_POLH7|nr:hypothetical protein AJ80_03419 [Polytolypa hystricis UAMH7299]
MDIYRCMLAVANGEAHRYDIAKDELEIAAESTASNTIYAVSDRITLREALDDLDYAYALYTGTKPLPPVIEVRNVSSSSSSSSSAAKSGSGSPDDDKEWVGQRRETNFDAGQVRAEVRGEIQRRVGQRVRELRHAVEALEESVHEGD